ncbi:MAG: Ig-like domain-containing protein [Patescibacteria group bacterium]
MKKDIQIKNTYQQKNTKYRVLWIVLGTLIFIFLLAFSFSLYIPQPQLRVTMRDGRVLVDSQVAIDFGLPITRQVTIDITPDTTGEIGYTNFVTSQHLARSVTYSPEVTWLPDTTYQVTIRGVKSAFPNFRRPRSATFTFSTEPAPSVVSVEPTVATTVSPEAVWRVAFDQPIERTASFDFRFIPEIPVTVTPSEDKRSVTITPVELLSQGQKYDLAIYKTDVRYDMGSHEIALQNTPQSVWTGQWSVPEAPGIVSFTPSGANIGLQTPITIAFSEAIDLTSLQDNATITPALSGTWVKQNDTTIQYSAATYVKDTQYTVVLKKGLQTASGGYLTEDSVHTFTTIGAVKLSKTFPADKAAGVGVDSQIQLTFSQTVDHASATAHFAISPGVAGEFSWDGNTLVFTPSDSFSFNTTYTITLTAGITGMEGFTTEQDYTIGFSTEQSVTKLNVVFDRQDHNLSCEFASLSMALKYKGANVGEAPLINIVGFDRTPKNNGVWGNPNVAFVGDIDGHQPSTGYGVYWDPIAIAAKEYRTARAFSGWTVAQLAAEIKKGNPVVIWGTAGSGKRIDWKTPQGGNVVAVSGEHARVAIGYIGPAENPTKIITMDPLYGEKHFTRSSFEWNWGVLGNSGVVIE